LDYTDFCKGKVGTWASRGGGGMPPPSVSATDIGVKCVTFVSENFTWYGSNITNVWQEIFTPMTLAFSCEAVHEKLWKSVNICKSYSKKISGTFFSGHGVHFIISDKVGCTFCPCLSVCLSVCLLAKLLKKRPRIWMKCCMSTDVGTRTNWLTFEPDPDHSPDAGTELLSPISYRLRNVALLRGLLRRENPAYTYWRRATTASRGFKMVLFTEPFVSKVNTLYRVSF